VHRLRLTAHSFRQHFLTLFERAYARAKDYG